MTPSRVENGRRVIDGWDRVFKAIAAEPRRQIIVSLLDVSGSESITLPDSAINPNVSVDRERLRLQLKHVHLPLLAEFGFVEWESDPFVATRGPRFEEAAVVFRALHSDALDIPDRLVVGCRRLERERERTAC